MKTQSEKYIHTFERAADLIKASAKGRNVAPVLADLKSRAASGGKPKNNPQLIIDVDVDSQMIGVPAEDYVKVVEKLRKFQLVHQWIRATCPNENGILVETCKAKKLQKAVSKICPHCGQTHEDLDEENIEYFFAINLSLQDKPTRLIELVQPEKVSSSRVGQFFVLIGKAFGALVEKKKTHLAHAVGELEKNRPATTPPRIGDVAIYFLLFSALMFLASSALILVCCYKEQYVGAAIIGCLYILLMVVSGFVLFRLIGKKFIVSRSILSASHTFSLYFLARSFLDGFSGAVNSTEDPYKPEYSFRWNETESEFVSWAIFTAIAGWIITAVLHCLERCFSTPKS